MKLEDLNILVGTAEVAHIDLVTSIEVVAIMLHDKISPTNYLTLTPEQRNSSRRRANTLINEALHYWDSEVRKRQTTNETN